MVRYYRRRYRPYPKKKWEVQNKAVTIETGRDPQTEQVTHAEVPLFEASGTEGRRTIKNISVQLTTPLSFRWAIIYVPQGTQIGQLLQQPPSSAISIYEPNQNVMAAGAYDSGSGPNRIFTPLARTLNSGDRVFLMISGIDQTTIRTIGVVSYAISYN